MWALSELSECEQFSQIPLQSTRVGQNPSASCQSVSSWNPPMNLSHKYLAFLGCLPQWRTHPRLFKTAFLSPSKLCSLGWQFSKDRKTPSMRVTRYPPLSEVLLWAQTTVPGRVVIIAFPDTSSHIQRGSTAFCDFISTLKVRKQGSGDFVQVIQVETGGWYGTCALFMVIVFQQTQKWSINFCSCPPLQPWALLSASVSPGVI